MVLAVVRICPVSVVCAGHAADWPGVGALAGGNGHALVIREEGQLWETGTNKPTRLGTWTNEAELSTNRFLPRRIGSQAGWLGVEAMGDTGGTSFALREDGSLWGWGDNSLGQLGDGTGASRKTPSPAGAGLEWKSVSGRGGSVFAVRGDGTLWAWGLNEPGSGMLGIGRGRGRIQYAPVQIGSATDWRSVQASRGSVAVLTNDVVTTITNTNTGLVTRVTNRIISAFSAGRGGAGLRGSGEIWAWGTTLVRTVSVTNTNTTNALIGAVTTNFVPVQVGTSTDWKQLAFAHSAFSLKQDGSLWRFNEASAEFEPFPSATNASHTGWQVLRGFEFGEGTNASGHVVGLKTNGTLWAWGDNSAGQVDAQLSAEDLQEEPWQITGLDSVEDSGWAEVGAGPGQSLALTQDGRVFSWGFAGSLPPDLQRTPALVVAPEVNWRSALAGENFTIGVEDEGRIYAWGVTGLTNAQTALVRVPEPISTGASLEDPEWAETGWTSGVAVFGRTLAAIGPDTALKTWGNPEGAALALPWWNPLREAEGIRNFSHGWGRVSGSRGQVGTSTNTNASPVPEGFVAAVRGDGTLWAWGANAAGQLGDGTLIPKDMPRQVGSEAQWSGAEAGGSHVLAWKRDGSLWGWGANSSGELGLTTNVVTISNNFSGGTNSTNSTNTTPRAYAGRTRTTTVVLASNVYRPALVLPKGWGVRELSAGGSHTLVLRSDRSLWSMGANDSGQLGLGPLSRAGGSTNGGGTNTNPNPTNSFRTVTVTNVVTNINYAPWRVENNVDTTVDQASSYRPQRIGNKLWQSVAAGQGHSLAVRSDGTLWAWGDNSSAQLGNGTLVSTNRPVQVGAGNRWSRAFAGIDHSLALRNDGTLWAWGRDGGRLGILSADDAESGLQEISFGPNGLATLALESTGRGANRLLASGLASFRPRTEGVEMAFHLDAPGAQRKEWAGSGSFRASQRRLAFSNLSVSPSAGTNEPTSASTSRFVLKELASSWLQPEVFRGTAVVDGTNCRATLVFSGDEDRDGIPDFADGSPRGSLPVLPTKLRLRIRVGETVQYEVPGLNENAEAILSADLSDLPPGLEYGEGAITGTALPEAVGQHEVVVGAVNPAGESFRTLIIEVVPPDPVPAQRSERIVWTNVRPHDPDGGGSLRRVPVCFPRPKHSARFGAGKRNGNSQGRASRLGAGSTAGLLPHGGHDLPSRGRPDQPCPGGGVSSRAGRPLAGGPAVAVSSPAGREGSHANHRSAGGMQVQPSQRGDSGNPQGRRGV
jgi:alpha-tubulin suppressor-like RCC1 family protein